MSRLAPGEPLKAYFGESVERMSTEEKISAMDKLGLNNPIYLQYCSWISEAVKGNFGISFKYKKNVMEVIGDVYINTVILSGISYIITFVLALALGIFCTMNEDKFIDKLLCKVGAITNCIPPFWLSLILILIFSINLKILPSSGAYAIGQANSMTSRILHLILPTVVLVLGHLWYYTYMVRNKLMEETRKDYVVLAKMKGLSKRKIIYKHCIKNILPSYISMMAISVPHLIGGTYIVEKVFSYPGLGTLCFESAKYHDYNMLLILSLITGIVVIVSNVIAQIINNKIDVRMKDGGDIY